jgi:hypothetical protein
MYIVERVTIASSDLVLMEFVSHSFYSPDTDFYSSNGRTILRAALEHFAITQKLTGNSPCTRRTAGDIARVPSEVATVGHLRTHIAALKYWTDKLESLDTVCSKLK